MIQLIRGFRDILPGDVELWQHIERTAIDLFRAFGFQEIRIPVMEKTELFARSIGDTTDIVEKEMYTFPDRKGDLITLRPEATASIVRSYIQHKLYAQDPVQKFYMVGPMFRRERPQKGRYRQFYQIDVEIFGVTSPLADVQLIYLLHVLFDRLAVPDTMAHINSLGCPECRQEFRKVLVNYLNTVADRLCADCRRRKDTNPLRVLDCKVPTCREALTDAPSILDSLCRDCREDFDTVQERLTRLDIPYIVNERLVRGLDYYNRTTFEIQTGSLGAQSAVAGGGRYDGLIEMLGGPSLPATGFAIGFDRLVEVCTLDSSLYHKSPDIFIAALGEASQKLAFEWVCALGTRGIQAEVDYQDRSLKSQMKQAGRQNARHVLIVGENELAQGTAILRDMTSKEQVDIPIEGIVNTLLQRLTGNS